ncbi:MAG: ATP-binding protein [Planctomycetota bacterium]
MSADADKIRILVVDDEPTIRKGCRRILEGEGYAVETAESGEAALQVFTQPGQFAAALVDLMMPGMNGLELIQRIRALDEDAVQLVITGYATIESAVDATKRGAYGYVPKPFAPDELLMHLRSALETRRLAIEARELREDRERRLLELAFERSKSNTIIQCMTDGVIVVNREGQVVFWNGPAERAAGGEAPAELPAALDHAIDSAELRALLAEALQTGRGPMIASREVVLGKRPYMANASAVFESRPGGSETTGAVAVLRDITELKKLEAAKSTFVSMVAHEIKRPLAAVESYLSVILSDIVKGDAERDRKMLERSLLRLQALRQLLSDLMNLTAVETGNFTLRRAPLDLGRVLDDAVAGCAERAKQKRIEISWKRPDAGAPQALADRDAMASVFTNLIDNAVKYTPEGGHVWVELRPSARHVSVSVRDDGIGMNEEEKSRAFDEFFRAVNEQTAQVTGTGLGLTLVKRLVEMHQGKVSVTSAPGKGSEFVLELPAIGRA